MIYNSVKLTSTLLLASTVMVCAILARGAEEMRRTGDRNRFQSVPGVDSVLVTQCDIKCNITEDEAENEECFSWCMSSPFEKHGKCLDQTPLSSLVCFIYCSGDASCPSEQKCCEHSCGSSCYEVAGLEDDEDLPAVPTMVVAKEEATRSGVTLSWTVHGARDSNERVLYVVEERHHIGFYFNERLMGGWSPLCSTPNKSAYLTNVLKRGYFYQFRVASVNANGTKGFSPASEGFALTKKPRLRKPKSLEFEDVTEINGLIWSTIQWSPPRGRIPIDKYKVFWTYKLDDRNFSYSSNSTFTQTATVPGVSITLNRKSYRIKNLLKNRPYYIQVQAIGNIGGKTLKSKTASKIFDMSYFERQNKRGKKRTAQGMREGKRKRRSRSFPRPFVTI